MYTANHIANYIINWCHEHRMDITNLKLQKLLYFVQGFYFRFTHQRLIRDEFYAWQLGPVAPEVYSKYAIYSASTIPQQATVDIAETAQIFVDQILQKLAPLSAWQLVNRSHEEDPWKYNFEIFGDKSQIPFKSIANYYGGYAEHDD